MVPQYNLTGGSMAKTTGRTNLLIASGFQHEAPLDVVSFPAEIHNKSAKPNSDILIYIHSMTDEEAYRSTEVGPSESSESSKVLEASNASNLAKSTSGNEIRSSIELTGGFSGALPGFFKRLKPRFWTTGDGSSDGENS
nr:hypothetical protein Iba_chr01dCG14180 [Ipomoea batatas]GMD29674.1 hypothetical protein Iba_scaffold1221880CG0010 [Ipomoea batatas]